MIEQLQDRAVVLAVVILLGAFALGGLAGTVWLIHDDKDPSAIAVVSGLTGTALGALGAVLASTRSVPPAPVAEPDA